MWKENWTKSRQDESVPEDDFPAPEEEPASRKRSQESPDTLPAKKKRKAINHSDRGEEVRPVCEEKKEFLRSGPASSTVKSVRQTFLITLSGRIMTAPACKRRKELKLNNSRRVVKAGVNYYDSQGRYATKKWDNPVLQVDNLVEMEF